MFEKQLIRFNSKHIKLIVILCAFGFTNAFENANDFENEMVYKFTQLNFKRKSKVFFYKKQ